MNTGNNGSQAFYAQLADGLNGLRQAGLFKPERVLASRQGAEVVCDDGKTLLNLCANNYLGLSGDESMVQASIAATEQYGYGLSSVRFICGTQDLHKELERAWRDFLGTEDTILYAAAFDANGGLFEPLLDEQDAIICDALNHASIIDGIRLCKATRFRYAAQRHGRPRARSCRPRAAGARFKLVVTDGVFSMDGTIAQLDKIRDLCDRYGALVGIDECHATGFMGATGRGTHEHRGVFGKIDIITGTLGKALGGASGGFTAARREVIELLRQRSRPYLFSNTVAPAIVGASLAVLQRLLRSSTELRDKLHDNTALFPPPHRRSRLRDQARRPIRSCRSCCSMRRHGAATVRSASVELGCAVGFFFPVVPRGRRASACRCRRCTTAEHLETGAWRHSRRPAPNSGC